MNVRLAPRGWPEATSAGRENLFSNQSANPCAGWTDFETGLSASRKVGRDLP